MSKCWIPTVAGDACSAPFTLVDIIARTDDGVVRVRTASGEERAVPEADVSLPNGDRTENDNTALLNLSEATLLHNLTERFKQDEIYTFTGKVVTSLNPCKQLPHLYSVDRMRAAAAHQDETEPSLFVLADAAYSGMCQGRDQSVVVSGVSGAGKTEAIKKIAEYLCWRSSDRMDQSVTAQRVLQSNPVFEAFGNASTNSNPNSSRFGKFTKLCFGADGQMVSTNVHTFLLEKSRVAFQQQGDRNYHILHQLAAASPSSLERLGLHSETRASGYIPTQGVDACGQDSAAFIETVDAMEALALKPSEVLQLMCGVLSLGNIHFDPLAGGGEAAEGSEVRDGSSLQDALSSAQQLLGLQGLNGALTSRIVQAGGGRSSIYQVALSVSQAYATRDALAKRIYERVFAWLVRRTNQALQAPETMSDATTFIGLLDVFGFEIFEVNSFEQLLINLANEKLQRFFLDSVINDEQQIYAAEKIEWAAIDVPDNSLCVAAIEGAPAGILPLLEEQCRLGERGSSAAFCELLNGRNGACRAATEALDQRELTRFRPREHFKVKHFVHTVTYSARSFVEKNRDTVFQDLVLLLHSSTNPLMKEIFPSEQLRSHADIAREGTGRTFASVSTTFGLSLSTLLHELSATSASFVRCIKPNAALEPGVYNEQLVLHQLRTCGMLQAVQLLKTAYGNRIKYDEITRRFGSRHGLPEMVRELSPRDFVLSICAAFDVEPSEYALGSTKLFFKAGQAVILNTIFRDTGDAPRPGHELALISLKLWQWHRERRVVARLLRWRRHALRSDREQPWPTELPDTDVPTVHAYRRLRRSYAVSLVRGRAATRIQKHARAFRQRALVFAHRAALFAATRIQQQERCRQQRARFVRLQASIRAATRIEKHTRSRQQRVRFVRSRAATRLQDHLRYRQRHAHFVRSRAATRLQDHQRYRQRHAHFVRTRAAATLLQRAYSSHTHAMRSKRAAITLQAASRRREAGKLYIRQRAAAVVVQSAGRRRSAQQQHRAKLVEMAAACTVQSTWRMVKIQRLHRRLATAAAELKRGITLMKFKDGGHGREWHKRFVWLTEDMKQLCWGKSEESGYNANKAMDCSGISALSTGGRTAVMKKQMNSRRSTERPEHALSNTMTSRTFSFHPGKAAADKKSDCAFSVIGHFRTLDFVAPDTMTRDRIFGHLQMLLQHTHTFEVNARRERREEVARLVRMKTAAMEEMAKARVSKAEVDILGSRKSSASNLALLSKSPLIARVSFENVVARRPHS